MRETCYRRKRCRRKKKTEKSVPGRNSFRKPCEMSLRGTLGQPILGKKLSGEVIREKIVNTMFSLHHPRAVHALRLD